MASRGKEDDTFLHQLADRINRYGLRTAAVIGLEAGRPLAFFGGQLLWMMQPVLGLVVPGEDVSRTARILEDPAALEKLVRLLEREDRE